MTVCGEPALTRNYTPIDQQWCKNHMIKDVLNSAGDWRMTSEYPLGQRPVFYELIALEKATRGNISEHLNKCGKAYLDCVREIKPIISNYNIYGRIVNKKVKGCSHFYKLLQMIRPMVGWHSAMGWKEI